jgi:peptide methionine sulfoxide reductase msrA/msrB
MINHINHSSDNSRGAIMSKYLILIFFLSFVQLTSCKQPMEKYNKLTPEEERVIVNKGTERPFTGKYDKFWQSGTYVCKRCGAKLYRSTDKFEAYCGWPAFDDAIPGAVKQIPDADGERTEIECANCGAHLGHVFTGEHITEKNTRYCVNSISMDFIPDDSTLTKTQNDPAADTLEEGIFAGGCFWGVEYFMSQIPGVVTTVVGYIGGTLENPTYSDVCSNRTGYAEACRVTYDPKQTDFETVAKMFFEIHDPTQYNHQGPDYGTQYRSAVFYENEKQKQTTEKLISHLKDKGYKVITEVVPATRFWKAEDYHQDYYEKNGHTPYCHAYAKKF